MGMGLLMGNFEEGLRWLDQAGAGMKTARDCLKDGGYYATAFLSLNRQLRGL